MSGSPGNASGPMAVEATTAPRPPERRAHTNVSVSGSAFTQASSAVAFDRFDRFDGFDR
ncbi:hypothetical protein ACWD4T_38160 [Streptomyces umbrinus]